MKASRKPKQEMNYCHRCGTKLTQQGLPHVFVCEKKHVVYANASPTAALLLLNDKHEVLIMARGKAPAIGALTVPGGFCNGPESVEDCLVREVAEETQLDRSQLGELHYVMSGVETYDTGDGELAPVSAVVFTSRITGPVEIQLDEENLWAKWVPLAKVQLTKFYSPVIVDALRILQKRYQ